MERPLPSAVTVAKNPAVSFSCPHFNPNTDYCDRVRDTCVCGRPGCVLARNSVFAIDPAVRLAESRGEATVPLPDAVRHRREAKN